MSFVQQASASLFGSSTAIAVMVFLIIFAFALLIGGRLFFSDDGGADRGRSSDYLMDVPAAGKAEAPGFGRRPSAEPDVRGSFAKMFRGLAMLVVAAMLFLTIVSYFESTPGTGDILLTIVLGAATLLVAMHFHTLDRRYNRPPKPSDVAELRQTAHTEFSRMMGEAFTGQVQFGVQIGDPVVHKMDRDALALARVMQSQGKSIEEICLAVEPDYANWPGPQQRAFESVMEAALRHG